MKASTDGTVIVLAVALLSGCSSDARAPIAPPRRASAVATAAPSVETADREAASPAPKLPEACTGSTCFVSRHGFRSLHPTPAGHTLESVLAVRRGEAVAVGADGTMLRLLPDRIERIEIPNLPTESQLFGYHDAVVGPESLRRPRLEGILGSGDDLFVLVANKRMARFDGTRWSIDELSKGLDLGDKMIRGPDGAPILLPWFADAILGSTNVTIRDGGAWRKGPAVPAKQVVRSATSTRDEIWLGGADGRILVSRRGGDFVVEAQLESHQDVGALWLDREAKSGVAVAGSSTLFERDQGAWKRADPNVRGTITGHVHALWQSPEGRFLFAVGDRVHRRTSDGPWTELKLPKWVSSSPLDLREGQPLHAIAGTAPDDVWIVGRYGAVMYWDGRALKEITSRQTDHSAIGLFPDGDDGWLAVFHDGLAFRSDGKANERATKLEDSVKAAFRANDGTVVTHSYGRELQVRGPGGFKPGGDIGVLFSAAAGPSAADFYAVGDAGKAWHVVGSKATPITTGVTGDLHAIAVAGPRDIWIGGDDVILRGDGEKFRIVTKLDQRSIRAIAVRAHDDVWLAGSAGIVIHWNGKKLRRFEHVSTGGLDAVVADHRGVWVAGGPDVAFFDGTKWTMVDAGAPDLFELVLTKNALIGAGAGGTIVSGPATFDGSKAAPPKAARP